MVYYSWQDPRSGSYSSRVARWLRFCQLNRQQYGLRFTVGMAKAYRAVR